jgi:hypothetical protein
MDMSEEEDKEMLERFLEAVKEISRHQPFEAYFYFEAVPPSGGDYSSIRTEHLLKPHIVIRSIKQINSPDQ